MILKVFSNRELIKKPVQAYKTCSHGADSKELKQIILTYTFISHCYEKKAKDIDFPRLYHLCV